MTEPRATRPLPSTPEAAQHDYPLLLRRMERMMEVSMALTSTLDLAKLLRGIIDAAKELTDSEAASIMLFDPRSNELRFEATTNMESSDLEGIIVPVEGSIAGAIVTNRAPVIVPDVNKDPRWSQKVDEKTAFITRSILGVPLITRDKCLGALEAINKNDGQFTDDDVNTLQVLAGQAAVAITNARLFQQSDIISDMVHELRAPLAAMTTTVSLLGRPELPANKKADLLKLIQRETNRLATMTTEFLDMARLESGRMRFQREDFDVLELLSESADVVRQQAADRNVTIQLDSGLPALTVHSDRGKLKQVLLNLLTNGIKYNKEGGSITLEATQTNGRVRVSVADTGKGISKEDMGHMFQKFFRTKDSEGYATGTGLGLPLAKRIVEALGGEMGFDSELGVGSTFWFKLPLS